MSEAKYATQWAAQFRVASDLSRRGYRVSLTLGNAKSADLSVRSPRGRMFDVEVKGLASNNFWLIAERPPRDDLFFILTVVPRGEVHAQELSPARFFIASSADIMARVVALRERTVARGTEWKPGGSGLNWGDATGFEDLWSTLPE